MGLAGIEQLKPFELRIYPFRDGELTVSRTGFTGDLGYEVWTTPALAVPLWDALFEAGRPYLIRPIGSSALNLARIEAGFIQAGADFVPAEQVVRHGRGRSPFELGLDWLVDFDKGQFTGRRALLEERRNGSRYRFVRLDIEGNKPAANSFVFAPGKRRVVGTVTSAAWCPTAKTNVALASLEMPWGRPGEELWAEIYYMRELRWTRVMARARVLEAPVFDPPRRRQTPAPAF
jgi:aminomethyltransferase